MPAKCIVIGLNQTTIRDIAGYFSTFSTLPPNDLVVGNVTTPRGAATLETLLNAINGAGSNEIVVVAHGYRNGSGLYLPLVSGASTEERTSRGRTTKRNLSRLIRLSASTDTISREELQRIGINRQAALRLIRLMQRVRTLQLNLLEFRGCNLGRDQDSLRTFASFFGVRRIGAPNLHSFFGTFDANAGAGPFSTHRQSHRGTTYSYPFLNQNLYVCIGVNQEDKPANGHVVARSQVHIQTWIRENIKDITVPPGRNLPVHGLWQFPQLDLSDPTSIVEEQNPKPIFPLAANSEYSRHIIYVNGAATAPARRKGRQGSLDRENSLRYAANQSGPIRGGAASLHGEVHGGVHQQGVLGFDTELT